MEWMEIVSPYLTEIIKTLIAVIASLVVALLFEFRRRVLNWIEARTTKEQRELLHRLAAEAFSYAETVYQDKKGPLKLQVAFDYVNKRLETIGIELDPGEIRAAIEKAVLEYNEKVKKGA